MGERRQVPGAKGFEIEPITHGCEVHYLLFYRARAVDHGPGLNKLYRSAVFKRAKYVGESPT